MHRSKERERGSQRIDQRVDNERESVSEWERLGEILNIFEMKVVAKEYEK